MLALFLLPRYDNFMTTFRMQFRTVETYRGRSSPLFCRKEEDMPMKRSAIRPVGAATRRRWGSPATMIIVLLIMLWPYAISVSDDGVAVTVINGTRYFLHITINGAHFLYVAPGGSVAQQTNSLATVVMEAAYSPGQEVAGSGSKAVDPVRVDQVSNSSSCSGTRGGNDCMSTTSANANITPVSWTVTPADLKAD